MRKLQSSFTPVTKCTLVRKQKKKIEKAYIQNYSQLHTRQTLKINLNVVYNSKAVQGNVTNTHK